MKKFYDKIKVSFTALWIAIISFSSKVFAQVFEYEKLNSQTAYGIARVQTKYGVVNPIVNPITDGSTPIIIAVKIVQIVLIIIIPIIGIINLIKIRKIDDKLQKNKKIKRTFVTLLAILIIILLLFLTTRLLKKYNI